MKRGIATFTLDYGTCPRWLFERMVKLGQEMVRVLIDEYGPNEFIARIADPVWFQSLGTVLAFDWNASGLTTILTAALKEAIRGHEKELGIFICGGKGKTSRKTPDEIALWGKKLYLQTNQTENLIYNSKMSAKVDSALIQDGYQIYHHAFFFSKKGAWAVVQQGMNTGNQTARRYHWSSESANDLIIEPHKGIVSDLKLKSPVLNMTALTSQQSRDLSVDMVDAGYNSVIKDIQLLRKHSSRLSKMMSFSNGEHQLSFLELANTEFTKHPVINEDFSKSLYLEKVLAKVCANKPKTYKELIAQEGVGPKTVRALALVGEVIYGAEPSYKDPARYSFAHGGKDATPYPVDKKTYDQTIEILRKAVIKTKLTPNEKNKAITNLISATK
ncbi:TPA: DUF763 domain-containing protein [Candidatus Dependentiae bacterium]|nr:MAG: hypothetical protein UR14_C0007G0009 [candidate division TM6 bacterium GW2011_GWE2_31_21]KKP53630.1 MAG: hypothetical protein UR43_C0004G0171 [candidate division TM6 bacterium GW2011_GWF2_33_332]HBS48130.1 DUF763 domain-containing protein [Candidatus Dependentiae bacterium]HBZ73554.1 DUF763 domain-containing protein [Candidatus Dependentiae bacterium]